MAKLFSISGSRISAAAKSVSLSVVRDDFSVKVTVAGDPIYWVRAEPLGAGRANITDFNAGSQDELALFKGIHAAVRDACGGSIEELVFVNLVPSETNAQKLAFRLERTVELLRRASDWLARTHGTRVDRFDVSQVRGKFNVTVGFALG